PLSPAVCTLRLDLQIRNVGRYRRQVRAEYARQTWQVDIEIKFRDCRIAIQDAVDAGHTPGKLLEADAHLQQNGGAQRFHCRCVSNELDEITESLFSAQEN